MNTYHYVPDFFINAIVDDKILEVQRLLKLWKSESYVDNFTWQKYENRTVDKDDALFPVFIAQEHKNFKVAQWLLNHPHPNEVSREEALKNLINCSFDSLKPKKEKELLNFLEDLTFDLKEEDPLFKPYLFWSVKHSLNHVIDKYLKKGCDLNIWDENGDENLLISALKHNQPKIALKLIRYGVNVHWKTPNASQASHYAAHLLSSKVTNKDGVFYLYHDTESFLMYQKVMNQLIKKGANLHFKNYSEQTPLQAHLEKLKSWPDLKDKVESFFSQTFLNQSTPPAPILKIKSRI